MSGRASAAHRCHQGHTQRDQLPQTMNGLRERRGRERRKGEERERERERELL